MTRAALAHAFRAALATVDLTELAHDALPPLPPTRARVRVLAIGKAAPAMAAGALQRWPSQIERVLVVTTDGVGCDLADSRVEVMRASHPLPDTRSVAAADRALSFAHGRARDLLVALVSGGASALVCAPSEGLTFAEKVDCVRALLASGASITEINTVRRHLSSIKGGGLARAAMPGRVLTLLACDVIAGAPWDIGSGPTMVDPTTIADARAVLARRAPVFRDIVLMESLKPTEPAARRLRSRVIASPEDLAVRMAEVLHARGYAARVLPASIADAAVLAEEYTTLARGLGPHEALVRAAEPSLAVPLAGPGRPGRGGRSGHLAALVSRGLPAGVSFLAGASDGVDGSSGAGGAVVDAGFAAGFEQGRFEAAVAGFDTAGLHEEAGTAIGIGATGVNLADVHVLASEGR